MAVTIKHRRYQTRVTVDDKLGAALVKHGSHEYAMSPSPAPAPATAQTVTPPSSSAEKPAAGEARTNTKGAGRKTKAGGKRAYNRRDMQAKD